MEQELVACSLCRWQRMSLPFPLSIIPECLRRVVASVVVVELFSVVEASEVVRANGAVEGASRELVRVEVASLAGIDTMKTVVDEVDVVAGLGGKIMTNRSAIVIVRSTSGQNGI
jgi:hypothetical protein